MNLVVHMTECKPTSTVASARIAKFLVGALIEDRFNLVDTREKANLMLNTMCELHTLIIVNGPMAFCDFLPELGLLVRAAHRVIWVQQDYTISPPSATSTAESPFRKAFADRKLRPDFWTTVKRNVQQPGDCYINWNQLTWHPQPLKPLLRAGHNLMYYGAYRNKRETDFHRYFTNAPYPVHISTTVLRGKKFKEIAPNAIIIPPFAGLTYFPLCSASIYIEDDKSHYEFHSPANRFYELLSARVPILFDHKCVMMLAEAGITPKPEWVVKGQDDVMRAFETLNLEAVREEQFDRWSADYVDQLRQAVLTQWQRVKSNAV